MSRFLPTPKFLLAQSCMLMSCMLSLTACQKPDTPQPGGPLGGEDNLIMAPAAALPENGAGPEKGTHPAAANAQDILAENDRVIADNKRMIAALQDYSRTDPVKLDRLTSACQNKLGGSLADGGAKKVFDCIKSSW